MTEKRYASEVIFTKDTPYLALTDELWGVFSEDLGENWQRYNGTTLYSIFTNLRLCSLVEVLVCHMFGAKPLLAPMLTHSQLAHRIKIPWKSNQNTNCFIQGNEIENVICKMTAILFRTQYVDATIWDCEFWDFSDMSELKGRISVSHLFGSTLLIYFYSCIIFQWFSVVLWYLQYLSNGDTCTSALH